MDSITLQSVLLGELFKNQSEWAQRYIPVCVLEHILQLSREEILDEVSTLSFLDFVEVDDVDYPRYVRLILPKEPGLTVRFELNKFVSRTESDKPKRRGRKKKNE